MAGQNCNRQRSGFSARLSVKRAGWRRRVPKSRQDGGRDTAPAGAPRRLIGRRVRATRNACQPTTTQCRVPCPNVSQVGAKVTVFIPMAATVVVADDEEEEETAAAVRGERGEGWNNRGGFIDQKTAVVHSATRGEAGALRRLRSFTKIRCRCARFFFKFIGSFPSSKSWIFAPLSLSPKARDGARIRSVRRRARASSTTADGVVER